MRPAEPAKIRSEINVTPLVDVVLVLLIIFMVVTPLLKSGPPVQLPATAHPPDKPDDSRRILVSIDQDGGIWLDNEKLTPDQLPGKIREAATRRVDPQVVIQGDARLPFAAIKHAMNAVNDAGFKNVGLIADRRDES